MSLIRETKVKASPWQRLGYFSHVSSIFSVLFAKTEWSIQAQPQVGKDKNVVLNYRNTTSTLVHFLFCHLIVAGLHLNTSVVVQPGFIKILGKTGTLWRHNHFGSPGAFDWLRLWVPCYYEPIRNDQSMKKTNWWQFKTSHWSTITRGNPHHNSSKSKVCLVVESKIYSTFRWRIDRRIGARVIGLPDCKRSFHP